MEGCPSPERLLGLRDPALASTDRDALTNHAEHCELCRATIVALFAAEATAPPTGLDDGERLDRYVIEGKLGAGAMGVVYAARDPELGRKVAIKLLHAKARTMAGLGVRLQREAQALARVSHPNVVAVHDVGTHHGDVFIAMELVRGETLRAWLARGQPVDAILARLLEAGRGLAAVHAAGLVHRDFKPDNVLVGDDGRARVTDFGLARLDDDIATADDGAPIGSPLTMTLTHTGTMLGTPVYAAPEQLVDARVDARADQFAFCATAYEALYGVRPYTGDTIETLVANARRRVLAPPVRAAKVPARTHKAIVRGLAADPADRHATLDDLLRAFERPIRRGAPIAIAGAIGVVAIGVGIVIATREDTATCDVRAELATIWNPRIAKRATDAPAKAVLDRYASSWTRARDQACRATPDAARTACLEQARVELGAVARYVTTHADPHELALVVQTLAPVTSCASARGIPPKAAPPELAGEVERIRGGIADVRAALSLDHALDAAQRFAEVQAAGAKLDYAPLRAELALLEGDVALARGDQTTAVAIMRKAISLAEGSSHDRLKAEAAAQLGRVLVRLGKLDEGATMLDLSAATVARSGESSTVEIDIANTRALLADARGATEDAIRMYRDTIAKYQQTNEVAVANTQAQLHMVLTRIGRNAEASEVLAASAATLRKYMPAAEAAEWSYVDECNLALLSGDLLRATQMCRREVFEVELSKGPDAPDTASALQSYALARELASDWQDARTLYQRAARIHAGLAARVEAAFALESAGRTSLELEDHARAVELLVESVALAEANPLQHLYSRAALGRAYAGAGQYAEAIRELEWAIPKLEALEPPSWNVLASARFALADALWRRGTTGDRDRAREHARVAKEDAAKFRDKFDEQGVNAIYRRRMTQLIARIEAWAARR